MERYVEGRYKHFQFQSPKTRSSNVLASEKNSVVQTYTLDYLYVSPVLLTNKTYRKVLPVGTVLAYDPATQKAVPNYTSYGFGVIGVLAYSDADCADEGQDHSGDRIVACVIQGIVYENASWDNGVYKTVLQATKDTLTRIDFVRSTSAHVPRVWGDWGDWNEK